MTAQLALPLATSVCDACGTTCGRPVTRVTGKGGLMVIWHTDAPGPFDPPGLSSRHHPVDYHPADATSWPCPHCGAAGTYEHRDHCDANHVHPEDCRCAWCTYGVRWRSCPRPGCNRGAHTAGPLYPHVVICRAHGRQELDQ